MAAWNIFPFLRRTSIVTSDDRKDVLQTSADVTRACSLGDQFKSGEGEDGLFHEDITFKSGVTTTFADLP